MKTSFSLTAAAACVAFADSATAQNFSIDSFTVDGGGLNSTGGIYSVVGTIGQPDASKHQYIGGRFMLDVGLWAMFSEQPPGGISLILQRSGPGQLTVSWIPDTPEFILQETLTLSPADWRNSPSGGANPVIVPLSGTMKFYRLFKP
jgi:hypothetical protein